MPSEPVSEDAVEDTLRKCCSAYHMIAMREAAQGDLIEYSYQVRLADPSYQSDLVEELRGLPDVSDASLLMQRATVEL
jgi:hypothetical protein